MLHVIGFLKMSREIVANPVKIVPFLRITAPIAREAVWNAPCASNTCYGVPLAKNYKKLYFFSKFWWSGGADPKMMSAPNRSKPENPRNRSISRKSLGNQAKSKKS